MPSTPQLSVPLYRYESRLVAHGCSLAALHVHATTYPQSHMHVQTDLHRISAPVHTLTGSNPTCTPNDRPAAPTTYLLAGELQKEQRERLLRGEPVRRPAMSIDRYHGWNTVQHAKAPTKPGSHSHTANAKALTFMLTQAVLALTTFGDERLYRVQEYDAAYEDFSGR